MGVRFPPEPFYYKGVFLKVFVTGSSGYLGKPLVAELKKEHEVIEFDLVNGFDILNYARLLAEMKSADVVVHCAAILKPIETKSFEDYFLVNCVGTMNVARAMIENKIKKLIFISSTGYYGVERGVPVNLPLKEEQSPIMAYLKADDLSCAPSALRYSESKVIAENILAYYGLTKQIQIICLRFPRIGDKDGPHGTKVSMSNAINSIIKSIELKDTLWFEAFNISDELKTVDISKATKVLGYVPNKN